MFAVLGRIWRRWKDFDVAQKIHAVACVIPVLIMLFTRGPNAIDRSGYKYFILETLAQWFIGIPALFILAPVIGASQIGLLWLSRRSPDAWMRWLFCSAAIVLLYPYRQFLLITDLTRNSTAGLAAMFYPLYLAAVALPIAACIWWIVGRYRRLAGKP